jgi:hypothetical protein
LIYLTDTYQQGVVSPGATFSLGTVQPVAGGSNFIVGTVYVTNVVTTGFGAPVAEAILVNATNPSQTATLSPVLANGVNPVALTSFISSPGDQIYVFVDMFVDPFDPLNGQASSLSADVTVNLQFF